MAGMILTLFLEKIISVFGLKKTLILVLIGANIGLLFLSMPNVIFLSLSTVIFVAGFSIVIPTMIQVMGHLGGAQ